MSSPPVNVAVEGDSDEAVVRALFRDCHLTPGVFYVQKGKDKLDRKLSAFNHAAVHAPWLVLRDLDQDADCAPKHVDELLPHGAAHMIFRIAVRAAESWLLADRKNMSDFLGVALNKISVHPDQLANPKADMVNLARRSRKRPIREDMVPGANSTASVGPAYVSRIVEFATNHWRPGEAAQFSASLKKCIAALGRIAREED